MGLGMKKCHTEEKGITANTPVKLFRKQEIFKKYTPNRGHRGHTYLFSVFTSHVRQAMNAVPDAQMPYYIQNINFIMFLRISAF